jgi:hypothetical protein
MKRIIGVTIGAVALTGAIATTTSAYAAPSQPGNAPLELCDNDATKFGVAAPDSDLTVYDATGNGVCGHAYHGHLYNSGCVDGSSIKLQSDTGRWGWVHRQSVSVVEGSAPAC